MVPLQEVKVKPKEKKKKVQKNQQQQNREQIKVMKYDFLSSLQHITIIL